MLISKWLPASHIGCFGFRTLTLVWLWISTPNLSGTILYIWVEAYWFSVTALSKWPPGGHIGFFSFRTNFSLALNINSKLQWQNTYCIWIRAYWFLVTSFSKWLPGGQLDFSVSGWHGFGSITQVCFGISVSNFMCTSFVTVGRSLKIVSYVAFKMAALWFWTMFNCNPPIAHCHPLLWGGGGLVDHWSTISSLRQHCYWYQWIDETTGNSNAEIQWLAVVCFNHV